MAFDRKAYMKEYHKKWYLDNKARLNQKAKDNHAINRERDVKRSKDWYENNKELTIERAKLSYKRDKNQKRNTNLKLMYGISLEDYNALFEAQDGRCAICNTHKEDLIRHLCVDHDHETGKVRGLLCNKCNFAIGLFGDDKSIILSALSYMEKYEK